MQRFILFLLFLLLSNPVFAATTLRQLHGMVEQSRFAEAKVAAEQMLLQNPEHEQVLFLGAFAYQQSAQPDEAARLYRRVIEINPALPEPRNNLAMIYLDQGDYDRASELLIEAINTHPSYATAYENLSRIYKGIASEAYRRALSESSEPAQYAHDIELLAINSLSSPEKPLLEQAKSEATVVNLANLETLLIQQVKGWAKAWSDKEVDVYVDFYSQQHHPGYNSHSAWIEYRRQRIQRPGKISVDISDIQFRYQSDNGAIVDFKQDYSSARYSDSVIKRLSFTRDGNAWKISDERVLSVL